MLIGSSHGLVGLICVLSIFHEVSDNALGCFFLARMVSMNENTQLDLVVARLGFKM